MPQLQFISSENKKFFEGLKNKKQKIQKAKASLDKKANFLRKVADGDKEARKAFGEALIQNVTMAIPAQTMFGQFFKMGTFKPDRRTWYYTIDEEHIDADNPAEVYRIYRNGNAPRVELIEDETYVHIQPYQITSEEYHMDKFALELGIIEEPERLMRKASENIAWKLETDCEEILENGLYDDIGDVNGIFISDKISSFPTSNKLDLTGYDGLQLNTLRDIAVYAKQIGKQIETIYAPVSVETEMWDWLDVPEQYNDQLAEGLTPKQIVPQLIREKIVTEGVPGQLFGRNFNIQSINTLNDDATEDDVYMWVKFTGGSGHLRYLEGGHFKDEYTHEDADSIYYNLKKTLMLFQTPIDRVNYARVKVKEKE